MSEFDPAPLLHQLEQLRQRHRQEVHAAYHRGVEEMAQAIFPLVDGCDRALVSIPPAGAEWATGIALLRDAALAALAAAGYTPLEVVGQRFDPACHEAVSGLGEYVISCTERGWMHGEELLRPARVTVGAIIEHEQRLWEEEPELRRRRSRP